MKPLRQAAALTGMVILHTIVVERAGAQNAAEFRMRTTAASCLKLRAEPSANAQEVACLQLGTQVATGETRDAWRRVRLQDGREGWVAKAFLEFTPTTNTPRATENRPTTTPEARVELPVIKGAIAAAFLLGIGLAMGIGARLRHSQVSDSPPSIVDMSDLSKRITTLTTALEEKPPTASVATSEQVAELSKSFLALQAALDERDGELRRHKKGYDAHVFRKFLSRFVRVDQALEQMRADGAKGPHALEQLTLLLEDALDECGVERFAPAIGEDYRTAVGIDENPRSQPSSNESDRFKIAAIREAGYRLRHNSGYETIVPARVTIFLPTTE